MTEPKSVITERSPEGLCLSLTIFSMEIEKTNPAPIIQKVGR